MAFGQAIRASTCSTSRRGQREVVGNFPGMTFAPRFSPDGQKIIMSLSQGGSTNLYTMDLRSRTTTRLTDTPAIDTSPSYSPDGSQIVFEIRSRRRAADLRDGRGRRRREAHLLRRGRALFDAGLVAARATTSPSRASAGGSFAIGVMKPDGSGERILTEGFHNEGPTWAPNGLFLMFFRDPGGQAAARST